MRPNDTSILQEYIHLFIYACVCVCGLWSKRKKTTICMYYVRLCGLWCTLRYTTSLEARFLCTVSRLSCALLALCWIISFVLFFFRFSSAYVCGTVRRVLYSTHITYVIYTGHCAGCMNSYEIFLMFLKFICLLSPELNEQLNRSDDEWH